MKVLYYSDSEADSKVWMGEAFNVFFVYNPDVINLSSGFCVYNELSISSFEECLSSNGDSYEMNGIY